MKSLKLMSLGMLLLFASSSIYAQVSVNVNLGSPPSWAPEIQTPAEYYYIPDVQSYYDVRTTQFIYLNNGTWIRSNRLPNQYRNYNLRQGYKVVLNDYHGSTPYNNFKYHKVKYHKGYKGVPQKIVVNRNNDSHDHYYASKKEHHNEYRKDKKHGDKHNNGKGNKHNK